jgi:hypothetical protein
MPTTCRHIAGDPEALHHEVRMQQTLLGKTPTRPTRPVYGWLLRCTCGETWRVNDHRRPAEQAAREHERNETAGAARRLLDAHGYRVADIARSGRRVHAVVLRLVTPACSMNAADLLTHHGVAACARLLGGQWVVEVSTRRPDA